MATAPNWEDYGKGVPRYSTTSINQFIRSPNSPSNAQSVAQIVSAFGSLDNYLSAAQKFETDQQKYIESFYKEEAQKIGQPENYFENLVEANKESIETRQEGLLGAQNVLKYQITPAMQKQADRDPYYAAQIADPDLLKLVIDNPDKALKLRQESRANAISSVRSQLENQYNNLQRADSRFGYAGRNSDLNAVFNQQATQLADAGVTNIGDLRIQDGRLVNSATGKVVSTSNLGGQVYVDRDTGVQKWGDIFSGVKGGANYGIAEAPDGSVVLFPAWEKTKSPIAQVGLSGLESFITPILTIGGAVIGAGPTGSVAGAALGAGAGSTVGQLLASGEIDWENVAKSAAIAGAGAYVGGLLSGGEAAAADLTGTTTGGMLGPDAGFAVAEGAQLASSADLANAAFIAEDAAQLYAQTGNIAAVQQNLIGAGVNPIIAAEAANLSSLGFNAAQIASNLSPSMIGEIYGPSAGTLRIEDLAFVGDDAAQLYQQTGNVAAVQQNLIAAGVDPIIAAEASNLAALGQTGPNIASNLNQAFPGDQVFTSEGLLSGGSTLDDFAKDIGGNITSSAAPAIGINDALNLAKTGANLLGGQQQQGGLLGGGQVSSGGRQVSGVDYSGLLSLLQGQTRTPGIASLLTPVVRPVASPYQALLSPQPQYQPLSLLG